MGLLNRIQRITRERLDGLLSALEDPERIFPQLVRELDAELESTRAAEETALSAFLSQQRRLDEHQGRLLRLESALPNSPEVPSALPSALLPDRIADVRAQLHEQEQGLSKAHQAYAKAREARMELEQVLMDMHQEKDAILERARQGQPIREIMQLTGPSLAHGQLAGVLEQVGRKLNLPRRAAQPKREPGTGSLDVWIYEQTHPEENPHE